MNLQELTEYLSEEMGWAKTDCAKAARAMVTGMTEALRRGDRVMLFDFGSFHVKSRVARKGRNPRTGETIELPAANFVKFTQADALREAVNNGE